MTPTARTILITGASTGIGYSLAAEFVRRGYLTFGSVRQQADADRLQQELGDRFVPLHFDVTDEAAIRRAVPEVERRLQGQGLGGLVNNAGVALGGPLLHQPVAEIQQQFDVNVFGMLRVTQAFAPLLGARQNHPAAPGRILNMSSVSGKIAAPFLGGYAGSKFALEGLSHTLRRELLLHGIDVVIIGPGPVNTPIWDKGIHLDQYAGTPYFNSLEKFIQYFTAQGKSGLPPEQLARQTADIFEKTKPRTRYAITPGKFKNWTLPRLLPDRTLDRLIGKATRLLKK